MAGISRSMVLPNTAFRPNNSALPERRNGGHDPCPLKKLDCPTGGTPNVTPTIPFERRSPRERACRLSRCRAGHRQDRPDRADDRPAGLDRQADRCRREALSGEARHHRRGQEDRGHPQGRRRGAGQHQAHRAGTDRQRQGQLHRRLRRDAGGARRRSARHAGESSADRDGGRHLDHHRALALHRAHQLHARAVLGDHRGLGVEE